MGAAKMKALEEEAKALTGKDNAKARKEKSKQAADIKNTKEYIDAEKVLKGKEPPNGNFVKKIAAAAPAAAKNEPKKEEEAAQDDAKKDKKEKEEKKKESAG